MNKHLCVLAVLVLAACDSADPGVVDDGMDDAPLTSVTCVIPQDQIFIGAVRDGIPALTDPPLVGPDEAAYLVDSDRVIGFVIDGQAIAVPHNVLWNHEIHNYTFAGLKLAVTFCPLTGSSMVFDRAAVGGGEFGVSGLLFNNNLIMYDRSASASFWPQMSRRAECGPRLGTALSMIHSIELTWAGWKALHPDTKVVSSDTGFPYAYDAASYPYGNYEDPADDDLLFPLSVDDRRQVKERVLGLPDDRLGGVAIPFLELDNGDPVRALNVSVYNGTVAVFWNSAFQGAAAFYPKLDGQPLTFEARGERIVDAETESTWRLDGRAVEGPLAGAQLDPVEEAFVAFWFAWAAFHPETSVWTSK